MNAPSDRIELAWCQAGRCNARVAPGRLLCARHWALVPAATRAAAAGVEHRGLLLEPFGVATRARLEAVAAALEAAALAEGLPVANAYRNRAVQCRIFLAREHAGGGAQGRAGREDGRPGDRSDPPAPETPHGPYRPGGGP